MYVGVVAEAAITMAYGKALILYSGAKEEGLGDAAVQMRRGKQLVVYRWS